MGEIFNLNVTDKEPILVVATPKRADEITRTLFKSKTTILLLSGVIRIEE